MKNGWYWYRVKGSNHSWSILKYEDGWVTFHPQMWNKFSTSSIQNLTTILDKDRYDLIPIKPAEEL